MHALYYICIFTHVLYLFNLVSYSRTGIPSYSELISKKYNIEEIIAEPQHSSAMSTFINIEDRIQEENVQNPPVNQLYI